MSVSGTKRALLIGINYLTSPTVRLNGCLNDVVNIENMLMDAYGYKQSNIIVLRDDDPSHMPTRNNILLALQNIVAVSAANDEIWVHYSGHGTQSIDKNGDEPDGLDEAIVPVDYLTAGMISDDILYDFVKNVKCRAFFGFDSCHSGTICDLQYNINYISGTFTKTTVSSKVIPNPNIVVMGGCRDAQTSADSYDTAEFEAGGAFTISLLDCLRKNNHTVELMKLYNDICFELISAKYAQIPVLSTTVLNPVWIFSRPIPTASGIAVLSGTSTAAAASAAAASSADTNAKLPAKTIPNVGRSISVVFSNAPVRKSRMGMMF